MEEALNKEINEALEESGIIGENWVSWDKAFKQENEERWDTDPNKLCSYGIKVLDDALYRIGKNELVVIGAESGQGKSELSLMIGQHNAQQGKKVAVYYLEGGHLEAIRRMKWRDMMKKYQKLSPHEKITNIINFRDWYFNNRGINKKDDILVRLEKEVHQEYKENYKNNLQFYPTEKDFTLEKMVSSLFDFKELLSKNLDLDLIIIDHLQYFSLSQADNEITEITKILREVKHITEYYNTPVILVSHLRKRGKNAGLPTHEDFYGSGNIAKISTTSIMISPATDKTDMGKNVYPTYFRIVKSRMGIPAHFVFLSDFKGLEKSYSNSYEIYCVDGFGNVTVEPLEHEKYPSWARRKNNCATSCACSPYKPQPVVDR